MVLITPFSWLSQYTPKDKWLGGKVVGGQQLRSEAGLASAMASLGFTLLHKEDCPFLIREHARKFQWGCSLATVWRLS